ncbi:hypothetical protein COP1_035211 [Malus domestica]
MSNGQDENPFGSSSGFARTTVQNAKFEVEKFDGTNNFGMWQCEVKDVLAQQDLLAALGEKPEAMSKSEWEKLNLWACSSIRLCLAKTQKYFVMREIVASVLWQKLEDKSSERKSSSSRKKSHSRPRGNSKGRKTLEMDECAFCHNKGHWKKDCPKLKTKGKESSEANVAEVETDVFDFATKWVLDTGCTHHMTPHKDWFSSLKEFDGGVMFMGDDNPCTIKGIGTVHLKLHDGMAKELTGVRYVPNLKKNLISLGTLESKGFRFHSDGQTLKVTYGALVVMKAPRCGHLYLLQGSTVTGEASVVS